MNVLTLIDRYRDAIHDDAALSAWCIAQFGQAHRVYVGIDTRKPPAADDYPLVHIFPLYKRAGGGSTVHAVGITCGIYESDMSVIPGRSRITEFDGIAALEQFRKLVESAVLDTALDDYHWVESIEITYETIEYFPFFLASMEVRVTAEIPFDQDQFG